VCIYIKKKQALKWHIYLLLYKSVCVFVPHSALGMPKEKYDPLDSRRMYTIMSCEEANSGKKSIWDGLEITGKCLELNPLINYLQRRS